ncbi:hypothetical protein H5410_036202 [Solanum commersonii]|uniref:Uncharacterized protein n=1 Tax=Solanum commersonii TaxID=4109 RepID=A0A9J5Y4Q5_SOLCO|nr:hypothetical protein H5410_036202 [Solanum commersonii]
MMTQPQIQSIGITESYVCMIKRSISFYAEECCIGSFSDYTERHDEESPAEFIADNKNIVGFDNPRKCLYSTVREHVENALDSAESISELQVVEITILADEARVLEIQAKYVALGKKVKDPAATKVVKGREASYYRVTCEVMGVGSMLNFDRFLSTL